MCGVLGIAQPDESVTDLVDLRGRLSHPQSSRCAGTTLRPLRLRYCWASELDLMVRLAGLRLRERSHDWDRGPFTGESQDHISVYEVTAALAG